MITHEICWYRLAEYLQESEEEFAAIRHNYCSADICDDADESVRVVLVLGECNFEIFESLVKVQGKSTRWNLCIIVRCRRKIDLVTLGKKRTNGICCFLSHDAGSSTAMLVY